MGSEVEHEEERDDEESGDKCYKKYTGNNQTFCVASSNDGLVSSSHMISCHCKKHTWRNIPGDCLFYKSYY